MNDKLNKPWSETFIDDTTEAEVLEAMKEMLDNMFDKIDEKPPEGEE